MTDLWDQLALTKSNELKAHDAYIACTEEKIIVHFLMALPGDFEELKGSIFHHSLLLSIDSVVSKLLAEETHLKSHS